MAEFGSLALAPIEQLEKLNSELTNSRKLLTQKLRATCTEVHK